MNRFRARTGTYSIVAYDQGAGQMGMAVQTHWFNVGAIVPWACAGVGVVATQANVNVAYGPRGLELLRGGADAERAVAELLGEDPGSAGRQLAIVDAAGRAAAYTGPECFSFAGHVIGDGWSCQANLMASDRVWPSMADAYARAEGSLPERLLSALRAGEAAGGDVRGRQSAAIEVVPISGEPWERVVSLRVEDHPDPLDELERLYRLNIAYEVAGKGDWALGEGELQTASRLYAEASALAPDNHELLFWSGLGAAEAGDLDSGVEQVGRAIAMHAGWRDLLERLPESMFPAVARVREALAE